MQLKLLALSALSMLGTASDVQGILGDNIVLQPPEGKEGDAQALVFIIGADCPQDSYNDLLTAIQNQVSFPLWVSIPYIVGGEAIPPTISTYVGNSISELKSKYSFESEKYFFGGHSLGGAGISAYAKQNDKALGTFLLGSYVGLSMQDPAANYGSPVMTVGAQFDGWMARITRIAESYDQMKSSSVGFDTSKYTYPVVMVPGISHASFLNGDVPKTVQETDLRATVSNDVAIEQVSRAVSAFFEVTAEGKQIDQGKQTILDMLEVTSTYLEPILDIWRMEGDPNLSSFTTSSPWVPMAQSIVAESSESNGFNFEFEDEYKTFVAVEGQFAHAKPNITTSLNGDITVQSFSHSAYNWRTVSEIDAADYYAAYEIGAKMKSREAIYNYTGMDFTNVEEATCQEINKVAHQWVLDNFQDNYKQIDRFQQTGQPIEYIEDVVSGSGITWCNEGLITKNTTETWQIQSRSLVSPVDFQVPIAAGMLYCKLMSPARILEWMLVDGLKMNNYWIPAPTGEDALFVQ